MTPSDLAALREAIDYEDGEFVDPPEDGTDTQAIIMAAARRWLAVEESGVPLAERIDYGLASNVLRRYVRETTLSYSKLTEAVVDAALADISDAIIYPGGEE
jgi:hypothetical protein